MAVDYYDIDSELTEDERLARDTVRRFVDAKILPSVGAHYQAGTFPNELIPEFGELGLLGSGESSVRYHP